MTLDFEVKRCSRRCAATGRELNSGEAYFSVLLPEGGGVVRIDYSEAAWQGPPEGALGWWKSRLPEGIAPRAGWAPPEVMLEYFERLADQPGKEQHRYVCGLLLVRRRIMRLERSEKDESGRETLVLFSPQQACEHRLNVATPSEAQAAEIQQELLSLFHSEPAAPAISGPGPAAPGG